MHNFYYFFNFNNQQLIQYYALSHYHYMIISIVIIIISLSSHRKHSNIVHKIFTWKPKSWGENHGSLIIVVFQQQLEGGHNLLITMTSILQLQLGGDYNSLIYRLEPKGSYNSLVLRLQSEGGYNLLSFPCPATLI